MDEPREAVTDAEVVQPETVPSPPPPVTAPQPKPRSALPFLLGGVIAVAAGFGLAQVVPQGWPLANVTDLTAKVSAQEAEIAALKSQLSELAAKPAPVVDTGLADRLTALEGKVAKGADLAPLTTRLDALDKKLAGLAMTGTGGAGPDSATLAQLTAELEALKAGGLSAEALDAKLAESEARIAKTEADATAKAQANLKTAALHQLQAALDAGSPYAAALQGLGEVEIPPVLAENAEAGLPSLESLRTGFDDAARAALDAALRADMGDGWTDRVSVFLRGQTGARSLTPREGTDPDAILSRADAKLAAGDVAGVLTELNGLPQAGKDAMASWLVACKLRQDAVTALGTLATTLGQ